MAQLPPQLIHVKRKRTEDGPVEFLRIEQFAKRHLVDRDDKSDIFFYRRTAVDKKDIEAGGSRGADVPQADPCNNSPKRPVIHASKPGDERRPLASLKTKAMKDSEAPSPLAPSDISTTVPAPAPALTKILPTAPEEVSSVRKLPPAIPREPRRFHLSRKTSTAPGNTLGLGRSGIGKRQWSRNGSISAVFVERNQGPASKQAKKMEALVDDAALYVATVAAEVGKSQQGPNVMQTTGSEVDAKDMDTAPRDANPVQSTLPKRPGTKRVMRAASESAKLPDSMVNRWDADTEKLALDMHEYSMEQIGLKLAEMEKTRIKPQSVAPTWNTSSPKPPKFKPNVNVKRYHERHPEATAALATTQEKDSEMADVEIQEDDDEYVTETYERILSESAAAAAVPRDQMGLLVLEGEPDIEFFFGEEESDSDQEYGDDEDENAENYYAADYPDEEVASDDEFGRDPYLFRNGNASDQEEYGNGEDDDDDWQKPGWMARYDSTRFGHASIDSGDFGQSGR